MKKFILSLIILLTLTIIGGFFYSKFWRTKSAFPDQTNEYRNDYQNLAKICKNKTNPNCCNSSANEIFNGQYFLEPASGCPEGYVRNSLKCPDSLDWCEPEIDIYLANTWGLGSGNITIRPGKISESSEVEGGYTEKIAKISETDLNSLASSIAATDFFSIKNLKELTTNKNKTYELSIRIKENKNQIRCDADKCPSTVKFLISKIEAFSKNNMEKFCEKNSDCAKIQCKSGNMLLPGDKGQESFATCKERSNNRKQCGCY